GWTNKLIFGDNLQVLKALMDDPEVYDKNTGRGKVRLIYIDPPFATRQEFRGSQDQKAYQDKIIGSQFLEFLRKRLVFLRELLADDGSIYVHLDLKKSHYVKALLDEIFGEQNIQNEITWHYPDNFQGNVNRFPNNHNVILFYNKSSSAKTKRVKIELRKAIKRDVRIWDKEKQALVAARDENGKIIYKDFTYRWADDVWGIGQSSVTKKKSAEYIEYPTQKPEELLRRVIEASSNPGDLVLDAFPGSGTTAAVAEKLGRRWIMIDCGKLAIYTMQKRLLNLRQEIGNRGKPLKPKPFTLYNAGLYDYKMVKALPWDEYREFVLKLFQCRDKKHRIAGVELDGYLGQDSVMVFNYKKHEDVILDRGFIDDLHKILGDKVGYKFFIIAPAASVMFFEDYIEKPARGRAGVQTKYFALRIPYSIIDELHRKGFTHIKQPIREADVNDTIDAVGFDFIQIPDVECDYLIENKKGQMEVDKSNKEAVIKIRNFTSNILSKKPLKFENRETLSMVMVDYDYNGEIFDFDDVFYSEDLKKNNWEIHFDTHKIDNQMMIIYVDIFGNEKREVKMLSDFQRRTK
ncbi:MAG: site-specific DNA-methyltransferase, partial [Candidatus Cloacimonadota bacterium]